MNFHWQFQLSLLEVQVDNDHLDLHLVVGQPSSQSYWAISTTVFFTKYLGLRWLAQPWFSAPGLYHDMPRGKQREEWRDLTWKLTPKIVRFIISVMHCGWLVGSDVHMYDWVLARTGLHRNSVPSTVGYVSYFFLYSWGDAARNLRFLREPDSAVPLG